jgi:hypothetical protein
MSIKEQNVTNMSPSKLASYRSELLAQLSDTLEFLHRANLEINATHEECIHITNEDIREECARNGLHL